jgi:hypothetical protein
LWGDSLSTLLYSLKPASGTTILFFTLGKLERCHRVILKGEKILH